jgi:hypothetical protein
MRRTRRLSKKAAMKGFKPSSLEAVTVTQARLIMTPPMPRSPVMAVSFIVRIHFILPTIQV